MAGQTAELDASPASFGMRASRDDGVSRVWLNCAFLVLLAYALLGKGAAYIGVPPVFIGEALLLCGLAWLALTSRWHAVQVPGALWWLLLLALWGLARTVPYIQVYGMDAMRDAVIWGYGAFAAIFFFQIASRPARLLEVLRRYRQFATIFVVAMPVLWAVRFLLSDRIPRWPWSDVPIIEPKPGDVMVHLAGILAFWATASSRGPGWVRLAVLGVCGAVFGAYERAAMFAFLGVFLLCALFRPTHIAIRRLALMGALALAAIAISGLRLDVPVADSPKVREISFEQFAANVLSLVVPSDLGDLDDTKQWRLDWWREIVSYTVHGEYFWTGKGFGVNLADDDGFQVMADHSLRSPHSAHMVMLARAGVPGLVLWSIVQLAWAFAVARAFVSSLRAADFRWAGLFLFLLAYWCAFTLNASFDVFLEGPMGGIWFWSLYGIGLAALRIRRDHPGILDDHANPDRA